MKGFFDTTVEVLEGSPLMPIESVHIHVGDKLNLVHTISPFSLQPRGTSRRQTPEQKQVAHTRVQPCQV
jgi:hypothetical protein